MRDLRGWMEPGGFPGLQNQCDLTASGWVGSIPIHSRQAPHQMSLRHAMRSLLERVIIGCTMLAIAAPIRAQRPDSAAVAARQTTASRADSLRPPLSPRRAFLYSALIPGSAQTIFGRHRAAALMLLVEGISIAMIGESAAGVREARRLSGDTIVISYVDPVTGAEVANPILKAPRRFDADYVRTRQSQVEDWIAFLIANHLFSGADAFVAANLWDVPAQLQIRAFPGGATVGARLSW